MHTMSTSTTTTTSHYYSTPGQILNEEFLQPLDINRCRLAKALGTTPDFWSHLQTDYDLLTFDPSNLSDIHPLVSLIDDYGLRAIDHRAV